MYDVIVIGGGNAALCAAISACENGAKVLLLESAPKNFRGGNSIHTRNMRLAHEKPTKVLTETYEEAEYLDDLMRVTKGDTNQTLAKLVIKKSKEICEWLESHGVYFQKSISGTLSLSRTNAFFLAGGKTYVNSQFQRAEALGVEVLYEQEVTDICVNDGVFSAVKVKTGNTKTTYFGKAAVVASGGFESNKKWLREVLGEDVNKYIIRGTRFNNGKALKSLLDSGAKTAGKANQFHCVAVDGRSPEYDGGIVTRLDCVPFGVVLNLEGKRFYDEGEDFWPKRYAIWGRIVAAQPEGKAFVIIDKKSKPLFMPSVFPPIVANSVPELLKQLGLKKTAVDCATKTINTFNNATVKGTFNPAELDDCYTKGLAVNKTHWARPLDSPPFYAYSLRPGITFTYLGVEVNQNAAVIFANNLPSSNLYAAGELMAGNILGQGYLAGLGMTIGSVFGRIAGKNAATSFR